MIYLISRHDWMIDTTSHLFFWRFELLLQSMSQTQTLVFKNVKWTSDTMTVAFILFWFQDVSAVRLTVKLAVMSLHLSFPPPSLPYSIPPVYTGQHMAARGKSAVSSVNNRDKSGQNWVQHAQHISHVDKVESTSWLKLNMFDWFWFLTLTFDLSSVI